MLSGASPLSVFGLMVKGAAGTQFAFLETLTRATPLIFTGLAAAVAFRAKLWNIGGEAQLYIGAVMTVVLGTGFLPLPQPILIPVLMVAAMLGGAWFSPSRHFSKHVSGLMKSSRPCSSISSSSCLSACCWKVF